jgi:hypothetical protein
MSQLCKLLLILPRITTLLLLDRLLIFWFYCVIMVTCQPKKLFFAPEPKLEKAPRIWDIHKLNEKLGQKTCHLILFARALSGCGSNSRIHIVGKNHALKKLMADANF